MSRSQKRVHRYKDEGRRDSRCVTVTPKMAKEFFDGRKENRNLRSRVVDQYARDMANKQWDWCGDTLIFDETGQLIDGQHRCAASIQSGAAFEALIVRDIDSRRMLYMDSGIKRSKGDQFKLHGIASYSVVSAAVTYLYHYRTNGSKGFFGHQLPTNSELTAHYWKESGVSKFAKYANRAQGLGRPSLWVALLYLFHKKDPTLVESFAERVLDGLGVSKGDPAKLLRDQLQTARATRRPMNEKEFSAKVIKVWNACRNKTRLANLRFDHNREEFPEIQ